jgi:hypothetical protein
LVKVYQTLPEELDQPQWGTGHGGVWPSSLTLTCPLAALAALAALAGALTWVLDNAGGDTETGRLAQADTGTG